MARGDPTFIRLDIDKLFHGEKVSSIDDHSFRAYILLMGLSVKYRTDVLPPTARRRLEGLLASSSPTSGVRPSAASRCTKLAASGLIEILPDGSIRLIHVKEMHKKLLWDKCPQNFPISAPYGESDLTHMGPISAPKKGGESERLRDRDLSTDPDTEIVTPSRTSPPAGPSTLGAVLGTVPGAVDKYSYSGISTGTGSATKPDDLERSDLERWTEAWFRALWPHGEYDWNAEKDSILSLVRKYGRGPYAYAQAILLEHRREHKRFDNGELAYLNGIAREQAKKTRKAKPLAL